MRLFTVLLSLLVLSTVTISGHHGWAGYRSEDFALKGTVEMPLSLSNPHATMKVKADGQVWDVVLAPPLRTSQAGLREGIIPVGAEVTLHGHRHKDAKRFEIKTERVVWGERTFNVYPDRS